MLLLNNKHFSGQYLKLFSDGIVVVCYKADWCGFCQRLKPEYEKLSKLLMNKAIVAEIDSDENKDFIEKNNKFLYGYKVKHYPTIVIYKNGYFVTEYEGERKADIMYKYIMQM